MQMNGTGREGRCELVRIEFNGRFDEHDPHELDLDNECYGAALSVAEYSWQTPCGEDIHRCKEAGN